MVGPQASIWGRHRTGLIGDPYASLRDYWHAWNMNAASGADETDLAGSYNLVQTGNPDALTDGGRRCATTGSKNLMGASNLLMFNQNMTFVQWYRVQTAGVLFSNRAATGGQGVLIRLGNSWGFYCYAPAHPTQLGPFATTADSSSGTWRLMVFRYNLSSKTASISIDNGSASNSQAHTSTIHANPGAGLARLSMQTDAGLFTGAIDRRFTGIWQRELSAGEEALIYAAGSLFTL